MEIYFKREQCKNVNNNKGSNARMLATIKGECKNVSNNKGSNARMLATIKGAMQEC